VLALGRLGDARARPVLEAAARERPREPPAVGSVPMDLGRGDENVERPRGTPSRRSAGWAAQRPSAPCSGTSRARIHRGEARRPGSRGDHGRHFGDKAYQWKALVGDLHVTLTPAMLTEYRDAMWAVYRRASFEAMADLSRPPRTKRRRSLWRQRCSPSIRAGCSRISRGSSPSPPAPPPRCIPRTPTSPPGTRDSSAGCATRRRSPLWPSRRSAAAKPPDAGEAATRSRRLLQDRPQREDAPRIAGRPGEARGACLRRSLQDAGVHAGSGGPVRGDDVEVIADLRAAAPPVRRPLMNEAWPASLPAPLP